MNAYPVRTGTGSSPTAEPLDNLRVVGDTLPPFASNVTVHDQSPGSTSPFSVQWA